MVEEENPEVKEARLREEGRVLQERLAKTYAIDFDLLYGKADALEYAHWALEWNRYLVEWGSEESLGTAKDKVQTWEEALQGLEDFQGGKDEADGWKYLKAALRDEGFEYLEREADQKKDSLRQFGIGVPREDKESIPPSLGKALINVALSLPTEEID